MKIEFIPEQSKILVGKAEITHFCHFKNARAWAREMLRQNDIWFKQEEGESIKEMDKRLGDEFGCSISTLYKHFNKLQKKAFIVPVYHLYKYVNDFNGFRKFANSNTLMHLNKNKEILDPIYKDGLYNLLPVANKLGASPQELKKAFGSNWKTIANNSCNKNKLLAKHLYWINYPKDEPRLQTYCKELVKLNIPTTVLKHYGGTASKCLQFITENFKGQWNKTDKMRDWIHIVSDTDRLARQLGQPFNIKWSPRRMKEEHDRMARELNARKYSPDSFEWTKELPHRIEHEGFVATLLDSRLLIVEEGTAMGHCVASYADYSAEGDYLVYSVTKDGERSSTIGIHKRGTYDKDKVKNDPWVVQQHYGRFNASLKDEAEKEIGKLVIEALNREKEKECST